MRKLLFSYDAVFFLKESVDGALRNPFPKTLGHRGGPLQEFFGLLKSEDQLRLATHVSKRKMNYTKSCM